jgi:hypothetical protein
MTIDAKAPGRRVDRLQRNDHRVLVDPKRAKFTSWRGRRAWLGFQCRLPTENGLTWHSGHKNFPLTRTLLG